MKVVLAFDAAHLGWRQGLKKAMFGGVRKMDEFFAAANRCSEGGTSAGIEQRMHGARSEPAQRRQFEQAQKRPKS